MNAGVIMLLFLASCSRKEDHTSVMTETVASKVMVSEIKASGLKETLTVSGTLEADKTVVLGFSVSGTIASMLVEEGQQVAAGQLLATLEPTEYTNSLTIAEASLMEAKDAFVRMEALYNKGSLPERDYISARAKLAQAEANKNLAVKRLSDTRLQASIAGIVTAKNLETGASAAPGLPVFTIVKTDKVYSTLSVPEVEIGKVSLGMEARVMVPTLGEEFLGKVSIINPVADKVSKAYRVKVELENPSGILLPGMITNNMISTGKSINQLTVPANAIVRDEDNLTYLFLLQEHNRVKRQRVAVGGLSQNGIIITDGLKSGDKVVVEGQMNVKDGQTVTVL